MTKRYPSRFQSTVLSMQDVLTLRREPELVPDRVVINKGRLSEHAMAPDTTVTFMYDEKYITVSRVDDGIAISTTNQLDLINDTRTSKSVDDDTASPAANDHRQADTHIEPGRKVIRRLKQKRPPAKKGRKRKAIKS